MRQNTLRLLVSHLMCIFKFCYISIKLGSKDSTKIPDGEITVAHANFMETREFQGEKYCQLNIRAA